MLCLVGFELLLVFVSCRMFVFVVVFNVFCVFRLCLFLFVCCCCVVNVVD